MAITVHCSCGKTLKIDDKHRGKKAKCPACGDTVLVEEEERSTSVQATRPKNRPASARADDDGAEPEIRKPLKKAGKSNMMMYLIGGCGLLAVLSCCLLTAGGVGIWYFFFRGPPDDLIYVHDGVAGFVSVRMADIWKNQTVQDQLKNAPIKAAMDKQIAEAEAKSGMKPDDIERFTMIFRSFDKAPFDMDFVMVMKTKRPMDRQKVIDSFAKEKGLKERKVENEGATIHVLEGGRPGDTVALHFASNYILVMAQKEATLKDVLKQSKKPPKSAALTRGVQLAASGKQQLVAAFELKKTLMDKMPAEMVKQAPNMKDATGVIVTAALAKDAAIEVIFTFPSADSAGKAKKDADEGVTKIKGIMALAGPKAPAALTKFINSISVEQRGAEVVAKANLELDFGGVGKMMNLGGGGFGAGPGPGFGPNAAQRITSVNNLKQIGLAMHNFHGANRRFPKTAESRNPNAPGLSWRVALLPYIEQQALYNQIHHDEAYDSPHNRQFWNKMPATYLLPGKFNDGRTYYQVFRGDDGVFPQNRNLSIKMQNITDGTSNTILVVEAAQSVNWMAPDDIPFQKNDQFLIGRVGNHWGDNTFNAALADGSAQRFRRNMPNQTLQALITRAGGENVNPFQWMVK